MILWILAVWLKYLFFHLPYKILKNHENLAHHFAQSCAQCGKKRNQILIKWL